MWPWKPIKSSNLDKNHMEREGVLYKHICGIKSNTSSETAEIVIFHFSHYKSMGIISCHSNQCCVEANVLGMDAEFQLHSPYGF